MPRSKLLKSVVRSPDSSRLKLASTHGSDLRSDGWSALNARNLCICLTGQKNNSEELEKTKCPHRTCEFVCGGSRFPVNSGMITAFAAISGSMVGAFGSAVGTWITQRHQGRRDLLAKKIISREALYSDFIAESARLLVDALQHNSGEPQKLIPVYALLSRIRLSSSPRVLGTAEEVIRAILSSYPKPNLTAEQIESRALSSEDPLRQFSNTCRIELESLQKHL